MRELRPPEEVFNPDSMNSLKMVPITNEHPRDLLDCENVKDHQVGHTGDNIKRDAYHLSVPLKVTDAKTVEDIQNGKQALSCGYSVDIDNTPGNWMGVPYDAIQRNIRYNHLAIVDNARAGDAARLKMDSAVCFDSYKSNQNLIQEDEMKVVKIDGVEYQAEAKVIETLTHLQSKLDESDKSRKEDADKAKTDVQTLQGKLDSAKEENEKLKKDMKDLSDSIPKQIEEGVKSKLILAETAKKAGVEIKADASDEDIRKEVILKAFPNSKDKLDKADPAYIQARFDAAVELLVKSEENRNDNTTDTADLIHKDTEEVVDSDKARENMIEDMKNRSKPASNK